jgi:hypothetical protein
MKKFCLIGFLLCSGFGWAQISIDSIQFFGNRMLNDTVEINRVHAQENLSRLIDALLAQPNSSEIPLNMVKSISALESPDKRFRIITWNLPYSDGTLQFYGRIQVYKSRKSAENRIILTDYSEKLSKVASKTLKPDEWYGALYYQVIKTSWKKEVFYTLLGWDGNTAFSNKKLIDVLHFDKAGNAAFGLPIFGDGKRFRNRVFFEYAEQAVMSLRYQEKSNLIVFDHLSPTTPSMQGQFEFYSPDFTYDAFRFEKGKWQFISNYEARNEGEDAGKKNKKPERGLQPEKD